VPEKQELLKIVIFVKKQLVGVKTLHNCGFQFYISKFSLQGLGWERGEESVIILAKYTVLKDKYLLRRRT
jgi:hypothetical protein